MIEIALCLAVIGFALVAIIGVLPIGMSVQKENREDTIINFEANYLMDAIRSGSRGLDNLTNYVNVITNISTLCDPKGNAQPNRTYINFYTPTNSSASGGGPALTNGAIIMALLSLPKYLPATNAPASPAGYYWSNYVTADFRAITGSPEDQGTSQSSKDFAFIYRVYIDNVPSSSSPIFANPADPQQWANFAAPGQLVRDTNFTGWTYAKNLQGNIHELRLRFRWPVLPGGKLGNGERVFRSSVGGQMQSFSGTTIAQLPPQSPIGYYYLFQPLTYSTPQ
jgi:hypothetical protein